MLYGLKKKKKKRVTTATTFQKERKKENKIYNRIFIKTTITLKSADKTNFK